MDTSKVLFRCSALGKLMTEPKLKVDKEKGNLVKFIIKILNKNCNFINKNYNPELDEDDNNNPFDVVIPERDLRKLRNAMIRDGYFGGKRRFTRRKNQVYRKTKKQITIR
jgi:hypothetical protein